MNFNDNACIFGSACAAVNFIKIHLIFNKRNIDARSEIVCVATKKITI